GGVVRDAAIHHAVLVRIAEHGRAIGLRLGGAEASPLLGPEGNREFLLDFVVPGIASRSSHSSRASRSPRATVPLDDAVRHRLRDLAGA
ncbi:MAG TPA: hypothetical protein VIV06_05120, partial [Candidatus Limnocylindrales bacterium]